MWITKLKEEVKERLQQREYKPLLIVFFELVFIAFFTFSLLNPGKDVFSLISPIPAVKASNGNEVFGFAPYWKIDNLGNIDFNVLTTFAYFGITVNPDGTLDRTDQGYNTYKSEKAEKIFKKAQSHGTKVVLTLTQMDNYSIESLMDSKEAQEETINEAIKEVKSEGIDGINVDFEYVGNPGDEYRNKFTDFIANFTKRLHEEVPNSYLTVSVYASSVMSPKIYDIPKIADSSDGIFMMAYDFATTSADEAIPTSPLYGHSEGKYWYDVATAVDDFLKVIPSDKLILGVPWYGYNYAVTTPGVKAEVNSGYYTYYWYRYRRYSRFHSYPSMAQTYTVASDLINISNTSIEKITSGWDEHGQVGWKAYYDSESGTWRMIFIEDSKSMAIKYDFAKKKNLAGVGIWALGFDEGKTEMWKVLKDKFGQKLAANRTEIQ